MVIVIDAYNMLKQDFGSIFIPPEAQEQFLDELWAYSKRKRHTLLVVFDGGPEVRPTKVVRDSLHIIYAGRQRSADDTIKELVETLNPLDTLLITSDRGLRTYASRYAIISLEPSLFKKYSKASQTIEKPRVIKDKHAPIKRMHHESSPELDALMHKAAQVTFIKDSKEGESEPIRDGSYKASKQEKKRSYLIGKL